MESVTERFLSYVGYDTRSEENTGDTPSSQGQRDLATALLRELLDMGLVDASISDKGYVMATLPGNSKEKLPVIGLIAHLDTSYEMSGKDVHPQILGYYHGGDIVLNEEQNILLKADEFPRLANYVGQTLITTDGTTLLGADDKAGIAEIMTALEKLTENPKIIHGPIKVAFTPDEEIGAGADYFDVASFGADFAFTLDGGPVGELSYENFNAAKAKVEIRGRNSHPGDAKGKMINAIHLAMAFCSQLPPEEVPEKTEGYEGFFHLTNFEGNTELARFTIILRDFDLESLNRRKNLLGRIAQSFKNRYGEECISVSVEDQYYNMKSQIEPVFYIIEKAEKAMRSLGISPNIKPIRGGTDGSRLSFMNLPCPNLFTGGENPHGRFEYIPVFAMEAAVSVILEIVSYKEG